MSVSCPGCGQEVPVTEREVTLLSGACPGCARDVVVWSSTAGSAPTEEAVETAAPALSVTHQDGDEDCDGTLSLVVGDKGKLVGTCSDCGSEFIFTLETGAAEEEESEDEDRPRPAFRRAPRPSGDRPAFDDREAPRGRPCRKCGGTLRFETGDDGNVTGTCSSCGNTFTLPPRRDDRGGGGGYRGGGGGGYRGGGGGGYRGGGGGGFRGPPRGGGGRPPFRRRTDRDDGDDDRPRRRRRE
jgi:uncharacterized membrane protein YgcG